MPRSCLIFRNDRSVKTASPYTTSISIKARAEVFLYSDIYIVVIYDLTIMDHLSRNTSVNPCCSSFKSNKNSTADFPLLQKVWLRAAGFDNIYRKPSSSNCTGIIPHLTYAGGCVTALYMTDFFFCISTFHPTFFHEACTQFNFQSRHPRPRPEAGLIFK